MFSQEASVNTGSTCLLDSLIDEGYLRILKYMETHEAFR